MSANTTSKEIPPAPGAGPSNGQTAAQPPTELSEAEQKFVEEREAAFEANPDELYTWEEVVAYVKRKKP